MDTRACPACGRESFYRPDMDRFYHLWGESNLGCWVAITRGDIP